MIRRNSNLTTRKDKPLTNLKQKLITTSILAFPKADEQIAIKFDAYVKQVSCALRQQQEPGKLWLAGYMSKRLSDAKGNYDTTHMECMAVVWDVLVHRPIVESSRFIFRADKQTLQWALGFKETSGSLARLELRLKEFECEIHHTAEIKPMAADAISCLPVTQPDNSDMNVKIPT